MSSLACRSFGTILSFPSVEKFTYPDKNCHDINERAFLDLDSIPLLSYLCSLFEYNALSQLDTMPIEYSFATLSWLCDMRFLPSASRARRSYC